jgi:hypothetical protein
MTHSIRHAYQTVRASRHTGGHNPLPGAAASAARTNPGGAEQVPDLIADVRVPCAGHPFFRGWPAPAGARTRPRLTPSPMAETAHSNVRRGTSYKAGFRGRVISGMTTSTTSISVRNWTFADTRWLACAVAECPLDRQRREREEGFRRRRRERSFRIPGPRRSTRAPSSIQVLAGP